MAHKIHKEIIWEKWIDPTLSSDKDDGYDDEPNHQKDVYIASPLGLIPLTEHNSPGKHFNFWVMHTNFDIGEEENRILDESPGVESLDIFTRYRARISIARTFYEDDVKDYIETKLGVIK